MTYVLEVNDCALTLYRDAELEYHAPAIAVVRPGGVLFGDPALRLSRTHPRETNQQYFARLNADPLPHPIAQAANHADLVYLHLQEMQRIVQQNPADVVLVVSGLLSPDQLGVLLGIAQECGLQVSGFVDSAVVAATTVALPAKAWHIDVHLQRACVTSLAANAEVSRTGVAEIAECGFVHLLDGWINVIADRFVRDTRFDPLHAAETEQQLYNQVYDWVTAGPAGGRAEIGIEIDYRDHVRRVELPRSLLEDKAQQRFVRMREHLPAAGHVLLSARSARLPGLTQFLTNEGYPFSVLDSAAAAHGFEANVAHIRSPDGALRLVSKLPATPIPEAVTVRSAPDPAPEPDLQRPTHTLAEASAVAIGSAAQPLVLSENEGGVYLEPGAQLQLNGNAVTEPVRLKIGDEVRTGARRYLMIRVEP